jgi:hypothetical protein
VIDVPKLFLTVTGAAVLIATVAGADEPPVRFEHKPIGWAPQAD